MSENVQVDAGAVIAALRQQNAELSFQLAVMTARATAAERLLTPTDTEV